MLQRSTSVSGRQPSVNRLPWSFVCQHLNKGNGLHWNAWAEATHSTLFMTTVGYKPRISFLGQSRLF